MAIIVINKKITKEDLEAAKEDYPNYIKVTIDINKRIVLAGGQYHYDAEQVLIKRFKSNQKDIWGGGYDTIEKEFRTEAMINLRPFQNNSSMFIRDIDIENKFLEIARSAFNDIESLI